MMRSLYSAVAGLRNHQTKMDVIGNNISNVNTVAFKSSAVTFSDIIYQTISGASGANQNLGGVNAKQIGLGMSTAATSMNITGSGSAQSTGKPFDLRINDNGSSTNFFVVNNGTENVYTRDGCFYIDGAGTLCMNSTGYQVMGWNVNEATGEITQGELVPLKLMQSKNLTSAPEATELAYASGIIDKDNPDVNSSAGYTMELTFYDDRGYPYSGRFTVKAVDVDQGLYTMKLDQVLDQDGNDVLAEKMRATGRTLSQIFGEENDVNENLNTGALSITELNMLETSDTSDVDKVGTGWAFRRVDGKTYYEPVVGEFYAKVKNSDGTVITDPNDSALDPDPVTGKLQYTEKVTYVTNTGVFYDNPDASGKESTTASWAEILGDWYPSSGDTTRAVTSSGKATITNVAGKDPDNNCKEGWFYSAKDSTWDPKYKYEDATAADVTAGTTLYRREKVYEPVTNPRKGNTYYLDTKKDVATGDIGEHWAATSTLVTAVIEEKAIYEKVSTGVDASSGVEKFEYVEVSGDDLKFKAEVDPASGAITYTFDNDTYYLKDSTATDGYRALDKDTTTDCERLWAAQGVVLYADKGFQDVEVPSTDQYYYPSTKYDLKTRTLLDEDGTRWPVQYYKNGKEFPAPQAGIDAAGFFYNKDSDRLVLISTTGTLYEYDANAEPAQYVLSSLSLDSIIEDFDASTTNITVNDDNSLTVQYTNYELKFNTSDGSFNGLGKANYQYLNMSQLGDNFSNVKIDFTALQNVNNGRKCTGTFDRGESSISTLGAGKRLGALTGLAVQGDGKIYGSYDNGNTVLLGQIASATFANASGLQKVGQSCYNTTLNSGEAQIQDISAEGSSMSSGEIEMSNVDLSAEFTDMITTQRGFQANSRVITTSDSLLEELINLKR